MDRNELLSDWLQDVSDKTLAELASDYLELASVEDRLKFMDNKKVQAELDSYEDYLETEEKQYKHQD